MEYQNLLVFLEFPEPTRPSFGLLKALSYMDVTLVGFHSVPDGDKVGADREADIESTLEEIAAEFEERGIRVEQHVVTGESMVETRNEWASRDGIDAVLIPGGVNTVGRILVGVRDTRNAEKMADCVDFIDRERIIHIKLLHIAPESGSEDTVTGREALDLMKSELTDRGVNPAAIHLQMNVSDNPERELVSAARNYDLTVLGKTQEIGFEERVFGPISNRIVDRANSTVLIPT
jgi:nucleotide-binding universal stress UspA family protein